MDAFAISLCKGLTMRNRVLRNATVVGFVFGFFQAVMPLIGFHIGAVFSSKISMYGGYVTFIILGFLGINMIKEGHEESSCNENHCDTAVSKGLFALGVATSIDALAVGFTFSLSENIPNIYASVLLIGVTTFIISAAGVFIGKKFGTLLESKAQYLGGIILILLGVKSLAGTFI